MNTIILSDLHANLEAVLALRQIIGEAELVVCLGDFTGYYCQVNEVLDFIRGLRAILCVRGNHDQFVLTGCPSEAPEAVRFGVEYARRMIEPGHRRWLENLPLLWGGMIGARSALLAHGSPFAPLTGYLYEDKIGQARLGDFDFDLIAFGQTHRPLTIPGQPMLVNPGAVGQSRHLPALACAAWFDPDSMNIEPLAVRYDPQPVIDLARKHGAGEWITKHLVVASD
jgi:predicted phosphodiesterase